MRRRRFGPTGVRSTSCKMRARRRERSATPSSSDALALSRLGRQPLRALLDSLEHLALHDQRPGSIGIIPIWSFSRGSRKRLRLIKPGGAVASSSTKVQIQLPSAERMARTCSGSTMASSSGSPRSRSRRRLAGADIRAAPDRCCACRVQQVLDPVVGVGASARVGAHLRDPGPDGRRGGVDRDGARRHAVAPRGARRRAGG